MARYNCLIIGSGPAGFYAALSCVRKGYSTALVEKTVFGGTGYYDGCLPVKRVLDRIKLYERFRDSIFPFDLQEESPAHDFLISSESWISTVESKITRRLRKAGVRLFKGDGLFLNEKTYKVSGEEIFSDNIIIATGTNPSAPDGIVLDGKVVVSHREALALKRIPKEIIIIGGNVEGIEFASLFSSLGTKVTILEQEYEILDGNDRDLVQPVLNNLKGKGVVFRTGEKVIEADSIGGMASVVLKNGRKISASKVLVTGFRKPNFPDGLERAGVVFENTHIPVDDHLETNIPGIFAVGDINGIHGMAHIATQQGMLITNGIKGRTVFQKYNTLPRAMFTIPEVAGAGKQEWELLKEGVPYNSVKIDLPDTWRGFAKDISTGFLKVIFNRDEKLIGIWMVGDNAGELMSLSGLLLDQRMTKTGILQNLFIHPTLGEGILEGAFLL